MFYTRSSKRSSRTSLITRTSSWPRETHIHELSREFEGGRFEAKVFGWAGEDEAEVDVDDVTFSVQEDVSVVPERTEENTGGGGGGGGVIRKGRIHQSCSVQVWEATLSKWFNNKT